jgi:hypothetical protein
MARCHVLELAWSANVKRFAPSLTVLLVGLTGGIIPASVLRAAVREIREYKTHEPSDRYVRFAMTVTPQGDVLSLVPKKNGAWRLTRIQNWDKKPTDQTINVPGPALVADTPLARVSAQLLATRDGRFAISIGTSYIGAGETYLAVVDLHRFELLKKERQSGSASYYSDSMNRLIAATVDYGDDRLPIVVGQMRSRTVTFRFFSLPGLATDGSCKFKESLQGRRWVPGGQDCSLSVAQELVALDPAWGNELLGPPPCPYAADSADGLYRLESCSVTGRGFLTDTPALKEQYTNVYSVKTRALVGKIDETTRDTIETRFALLDAREYVLVMEGGTKLKAYLISVR